MTKKVSALALACALLNVAGLADAFAATLAGVGAQTVEQARAKIDRAGTGDKARVTVTLKDGTRRKGYVSERREADFVLRDVKTDAATTVAFADVRKVTKYPPPLTRAEQTAEYVGAGLGAVLVVMLIAYAIHPVD